MEIIKLNEDPIVDLKENQYYKSEFPKKYIFLHHTISGSVQSAIEWWNHKPDHVATPYLIDRDGKIYEAFNPSYWSYALGIKGGTSIEKASIHIELVSWGPVSEKNGVYKTLIGDKELEEDEVITFPGKFRGHAYYQKYTLDQIQSLKWLIKDLMARFNIPKQKSIQEFWTYRRPINLIDGIWSHTSVRSDKSDIVPQRELIEMIYGL